jgi:hypothetical protein
MIGVMPLSACKGPQQAIMNTESGEKSISSQMEVHGIKVVRIGHAVNGMMLDLRFRITDFERASEVLKQNTPLSIVDQATGRVLTVAESGKVGKLRNVPQRDDSSKVYWMFFVNAGGVVKAGSLVTLVIGDVQIRDIIVE